MSDSRKAYAEMIERQNAMLAELNQEQRPAPLSQAKHIALAQQIFAFDGTIQLLNDLLADLTAGGVPVSNDSSCQSEHPQLCLAELLERGADELQKRRNEIEDKIQQLRDLLLT